MDLALMKRLCIVLIAYWFSVINGKAIGHVIPTDSQLLLKTSGNIAELYNSVGNGGSWLQAMFLFAREDQSGVDCNVTKAQAVLTSETKSMMRCPNDFVTLGEHCYYFSLNTAKWHSALGLCQGLGSDLAHPMSAVENALLVNYLRNYHKGSNAWYIGGTDEDSEGEWVWARSKAPIGFTDWIYGQPDNHLNIEHCMCILRDYEWKWSDEQCNRTYRYICQN